MTFIYDDEPPAKSGTIDPPLASPHPGGAPDAVHLMHARSRWSSSGTTGTVEYNYTMVDFLNPDSFTRYGHVLMVTGAIGVLNFFLGRLIQTPPDALNRPSMVCESLDGDRSVKWRRQSFVVKVVRSSTSAIQIRPSSIVRNLVLKISG